MSKPKKRRSRKLPRRRSNEREAEVAAAGHGAGLTAAITTHPREFVAIVMAIAATIAIFVNALFLQHGPHPAPIFATRPLMRSVIMPPKRAAAPVPLDSHGKLVANIQQALTAKGFYDGAIDGLWGAKTDSAVRDFLRASGSNAGVEASDTLLNAIRASAARANQTVAPPANDPIARLLKPSAPAATPAPAPDTRVRAVQRVLAEFGYGQIQPTGLIDTNTKVAIEKFQREHAMAPTGEVTDKLVQALGAMAGHPLE
jgi:peptidoglycan hydrolase-like protein with peptidoglycan-binding domain